MGKPVKHSTQDYISQIEAVCLAQQVPHTAELCCSVVMSDLVEYSGSPDKVPEWMWVKKNASFSHVENGEAGGVWEFIVHLQSVDLSTPKRGKPTPAVLGALIRRLKNIGYTYAIFYQ